MYLGRDRAIEGAQCSQSLLRPTPGGSRGQALQKEICTKGKRVRGKREEVGRKSLLKYNTRRRNSLSKTRYGRLLPKTRTDSPIRHVSGATHVHWQSHLFTASVAAVPTHVDERKAPKIALCLRRTDALRYHIEAIEPAR